MKFILIYTTHKNIKEAKKITDYLLKERLIACVNFSPIKSEYWWKDKIEKSNEIVALLKTKAQNWNKIKKYIELNHPYNTPCIIKLSEVETNDSYFDWIQKETK